MLKKARRPTRPAPAASSPSRPEPAKTGLLPKDAPFRRQGRSERLPMTLPSLLVYVAQDGPDESPTLHASSHFPISFSRVAWSILDCARRTSTF